MRAVHARITAIVLAVAVSVLVFRADSDVAGRARAVAFLALPAAVALLPLLPPTLVPRRGITIVAAILMTLLATLMLFIAGWLYFPAAIALWVAVALGARETRTEPQ